eukprot:430495-Prymnesium_polylepis.1
MDRARWSGGPLGAAQKRCAIWHGLALEAARRTAPGIPAPPAPAPVPLPVVVVEATVEGRYPGPIRHPALVGRRILTVDSDEDGGVLTKPAT